MTGPFKIVALWCWYRGANFHGYQQQQEKRTVQRELLAAFAASGLARNPVVAGRTDKFVSARMQVLSSRLEREISPEEMARRLNAVLPEAKRKEVSKNRLTWFRLGPALLLGSIWVTYLRWGQS